MILLCYPKCSTCQKATKYLDELNIQYTYRDIKLNNPSYDELKEWCQLSKQDLKKFFNTSGILYRELKLKDKLRDMNEDEMLKLLASDGMLVKRPLLILEDKVIIGFKQEEYLKMANN